MGDSNTLTEKIALLVKDEKKRSDFGKQAREVAIKELDVKKCAERHLDAYTAIMKMNL